MFCNCSENKWSSSARPMLLVDVINVLLSCCFHFGLTHTIRFFINTDVDSGSESEAPAEVSQACIVCNDQQGATFS